MLIHSASHLITLAGGPQRGKELGRLGWIPNGAVLVRDGIIAAVGSTPDLRALYPDEPELDASGKAVLPGFVDPHTHLVFAGDRAAEFELRQQGRSYQEITAAGGGIAATVRATRQASVEELVEQAGCRAERMFRHGTTTAESKTGYGLETDSELRQLETLLRLDERGPLEIVPTFQGSNTIPDEFLDDPDGYVLLLCDQMLPAVKAWWQQRAPGRPLPFAGVFCDTGAFNLEQSRRVLLAARELGFPVKVDADEFADLGGARLAASMGAVAAAHLVRTAPGDILNLAASRTAAVALPCTTFGLAGERYTPAREIIAAGGLLAVGTDLNPGTAWCESMQFAIAVACRYLKLTVAEAIAAATINAAAAIGRDQIIGSIEPGKQADLLVLSVSDYRHLGYRFGTNLVELVIKKGEVFEV